jgi:hypothetical protein
VYVEGTIQGVNGIFTIDTGAARTVISETVYNTIPATIINLSNHQLFLKRYSS